MCVLKCKCIGLDLTCCTQVIRHVLHFFILGLMKRVTTTISYCRNNNTISTKGSFLMQMTSNRVKVSASCAFGTKAKDKANHNQLFMDCWLLIRFLVTLREHYYEFYNWSCWRRNIVAAGYLQCQEFKNLVTVVWLPCRPDKKKCLNQKYPPRGGKSSEGMRTEAVMGWSGDGVDRRS